MNWLTNVVRPKIRSILRRETPENLWIKCPDFGQLVLYKDVEANQFVIPGSNYNMRMGAAARLKSSFDNETWYDIALPEVTADPLKFRDERKYDDRTQEASPKTGLNDAIKVGYGKLEGAGVVVAPGKVLTNAHNLRDRTVQITFDDGRVEQAKVVGTTTYTAATDSLKAAGTLYINDVFIDDFTTADTVQGMIDTINAKSHLTGAKAVYVDNGTGGVDTVKIVANDYGDATTLKVVQVGQTMFNNATGTVTDAGVDAVATVTVGGVAQTMTAGEGLQLKDANGNEINLSELGGASIHNLGTVGTLTSGSASFQTGLSDTEQSEIVINSISTTALGVAGLDVTSATTAQAALTTIASAIDAVSTLRGRLGAFQANELESQGRSLATTRENIAASESAIRDTDFGSEMAEFSTAQILVQSATSFLAQANSLPQNVLSLIR